MERISIKVTIDDFLLRSIKETESKKVHPNGIRMNLRNAQLIVRGAEPLTNPSSLYNKKTESKKESKMSFHRNHGSLLFIHERLTNRSNH
ncbi:unnamed protein product [Caenorhabditis nigoni]